MIRTYDPNDRGADLFALAVRGTALVDPVDCTGAQGAGLALAFKRRWPAPCAWFKSMAAGGDVALGRLTTFQVADGPLLIFFPTKLHWSEPSTLPAVASGLAHLTSRRFVQVLCTDRVERIALPALGCGEGGIDWKDVAPLLQDAGAKLEAQGLDVHVFPPQTWRDRPKARSRRTVPGGGR